jgi:hypothetical protein
MSQKSTYLFGIVASHSCTAVTLLGIIGVLFPAIKEPVKAKAANQFSFMPKQSAIAFLFNGKREVGVFDKFLPKGRIVNTENLFDCFDCIIYNVPMMYNRVDVVSITVEHKVKLQYAE